MLSDEKQLTCKSAVVLANSLENAVIVVFTKRGIMARHVARLRPEATIFAMVKDPKVCRSLALERGVEAVRFDFSLVPEETVNNAATYLKAKGYVHDGDRMVIVSDLLQQDSVVDAILLRRV